MRLKHDLVSRNELTRSIQDYLKIVYELTAAHAPASTTAMAERLAVAPASVTGMLKKLAALRPPLVKYRKHEGALLTRQGRKAALEVIRRHRLIETWLVESLGYSWDTVHGEAEALEHVISDDFEERISAALGNPAHDPHGEPIPSADLAMPSQVGTPLSQLRPGDHGRVCRVDSREGEFLRYLDTIGIGIGAKLRVLALSRFDQILRLKVAGHRTELNLGPAITSRVFVEPSPSRRPARHSAREYP